MGAEPISGDKVTVVRNKTTTPSSAEVEERVERYLYSPSGLHALFQVEMNFLAVFITKREI
jgi:hypothetical protein